MSQIMVRLEPRFECGLEDTKSFHIAFFYFYVYTLGYVTLYTCGVSVYSVAVGMCRCAYGPMCACVQYWYLSLLQAFPFLRRVSLCS